MTKKRFVLSLLRYIAFFCRKYQDLPLCFLYHCCQAFAIDLFFPCSPLHFFLLLSLARQWLPVNCSQTSVPFTGYPVQFLRPCRLIAKQNHFPKLKKIAEYKATLYARVLKLAYTCVCPQERTVRVQMVFTFARVTVSPHRYLRRFVSSISLLTLNTHTEKYYPVEGFRLESQTIGVLPQGA